MVTNCNILYTKSSDVGSSFTSPVVVASPESSLPDIKAFEDKVYIVYSQSQVVDGIQVRDIFLIKSTDSGSTLSSPINLSPATEVPNPNPLQIGSSNNPHIDLSGDNVAITWDERVSPSDPHNEMGGEGQIVIGAIGAGGAALALDGSLPGRRDDPGDGPGRHRQRGAVGGHRRRPAPHRQGQRGDHHPAPQLRRHRPAALPDLRALEGPQRLGPARHPAAGRGRPAAPPRQQPGPHGDLRGRRRHRADLGGACGGRRGGSTCGWSAATPRPPAGPGFPSPAC